MVDASIDLGSAWEGGAAGPDARPSPPPTLQQLRVFCSVARCETLTRAAKELGLTQPSLSQQLRRLETSVGSRLFDRRSNEMELTDAGRYLLPLADQMLRTLNEIEDGLARFRGSYRPVVKLAGIDSVLRSVLPAAARQMQARFPDVSYDIRESAPAEIVEMLYDRRIHLGLVAADSLSQTHAHFLRIPIMEDPYVLVVPDFLSLDGITDPKRQLPSRYWAILNRSIHFVFGSLHSNRVTAWYDRLLPEHRSVAQCRSFATALSFVRAGTGVCFAPALATIGGGETEAGVRRYLVGVPNRHIIALLLSQHRRLEPLATLIASLQEFGAEYSVPELLPTPPFLTALPEIVPD